MSFIPRSVQKNALENAPTKAADSNNTTAAVPKSNDDFRKLFNK